ncbi:hypothetical protein T12_5053 [Trichinella patagoniensis]|uniref:DUF7107 domain-containing protein n=1 Tax=Trichinella patagoniensis TaxID=990121 RepID=A0A0V0ZM12_9BILA|nr:hypothetical protein T12_5053 [Trichinella patagoniensis]
MERQLLHLLFCGNVAAAFFWQGGGYEFPSMLSGMDTLGLSPAYGRNYGMGFHGFVSPGHGGFDIGSGFGTGGGYGTGLGMMRPQRFGPLAVGYGSYFDNPFTRYATTHPSMNLRVNRDQNNDHPCIICPENELDNEPRIPSIVSTMPGCIDHNSCKEQNICYRGQCVPSYPTSDRCIQNSNCKADHACRYKRCWAIRPVQREIQTNQITSEKRPTPLPNAEKFPTIAAVNANSMQISPHHSTEVWSSSDDQFSVPSPRPNHHHHHHSPPLVMNKIPPYHFSNNHATTAQFASSYEIQREHFEEEQEKKDLTNVVTGYQRLPGRKFHHSNVHITRELGGNSKIPLSRPASMLHHRQSSTDINEKKSKDLPLMVSLQFPVELIDETFLSVKRNCSRCNADQICISFRNREFCILQEEETSPCSVAQSCDFNSICYASRCQKIATASYE